MAVWHEERSQSLDLIAIADLLYGSEDDGDDCSAGENERVHTVMEDDSFHYFDGHDGEVNVLDLPLAAPELELLSILKACLCNFLADIPTCFPQEGLRRHRVG